MKKIAVKVNKFNKEYFKSSASIILIVNGKALIFNNKVIKKII